MTTKLQAELNLKSAKSRLSSKRREISRLKKQSIFRGVTIADQFSVGIGGIKPFRSRRKSERRSSLTQLGLSRGEIPMLNDELNLRQSEFDSFTPVFDDTPGLGGLI